MSIANKLKILFEKKYINILFFIFIVICWIPTIVAFFPGISNYDGRFQIFTCFSNNITSHHPIIHTLLLSILYKFGTLIFKFPTLGFFIYTLFQVVVMACIFSYTTKFIFYKTKNLTLTVITLLFFSIFPLNVIFPHMTTKDVLFAGLVLLYIVMFFYLIDKSTCSNLDFVKLGIVAILMLLFRNNAIYAFIPSIIFCLFLHNNNFKKKFIISSIIVIILYFSFSSILMIMTNAEKGSPKEKMSVITQAIGRIAKYDSNTLTLEEKQKIDYYFGDTKTLADSYIPYLSDKTKDLLQYDKVSNNHNDFYSFFLEIIKKYPKTSIDAFLKNCKGYWDIFDNTFCSISNEEFPRAKGYLEITFYKVENDGYVIPNYLPSIREFFISLFCENNYLYVPVLNVLLQPAIYFYFLIGFVIYALFKKDIKSLFPAMFLLLYFLSCFLGPCAVVRYIYCVIVCTPVLISRIIVSDKN